MTKIILITGGQRSGKSSYAERLALQLSPHPIYMATAHIWDEEFRERIRRHQERRGPCWTNIEEERQLSQHDVSGRVVLVDCLTLWCTNYFYSQENIENIGHQDKSGGQEHQEEKHGCTSLPDIDHILKEVCSEFDRLVSQDATFIFVTNEIGWGGVSANALQRRFTDLLGWFNQYVAARADTVILMVSGIAVKLKIEN